MTRRLCNLALASSLFWCAAARAAEPSTAECLAANNAALSYDNEHRLRAERAALLLCASRSCPAEVRAECIRRVEEVNEAIPTIVFEAVNGAGEQLSEVRVAMDDELLADRLEGLAIPVDPGVHTFRFETAGEPLLEKQLVIRQAQKNRVELIRFAGGAAPAGVQTGSADSAPASELNPTWGPQRKLALFATSIGVAGLGAGTAFGFLARSKRDLARAACADLCRDQDGVERWQDAKRAGNVATASFAVGGAAVAAAIVLWITGRPDAVAPRAMIGKRTAALGVGGRW